MNAKRALAFLLLTALFCLAVSACCFDPYYHHHRRGGRDDHHRRDDRRRYSLNLPAQDVRTPNYTLLAA